MNIDRTNTKFHIWSAAALIILECGTGKFSIVFAIICVVIGYFFLEEK